jgi:hypothetical protein
MKMKFDVTYVDGSAESVSTGFADFVAFEKEKQKAITSVFSRDLFVGDVATIVWIHLNRTKKTDKSFDEWLENVDNISAAESEDIVPLDKTPATSK